MNEVAEQYRKETMSCIELAIKSEELCRSELIKEFINVKKGVVETLKRLCETGIDNENQLYIKGFRGKNEEHLYYDSINKLVVLKLKKICKI